MVILSYGCLRYFVFNVLLFGLPSACYVFTKMFRPFSVHRLRALVQAALIYIDGGISGHPCKRVMAQNSLVIQSDFALSSWKPAIP